MNLILLNNKYSIYKFNKESVLPAWIYSSDFYSITRTKEEISVVAVQTDLVSDDFICNRDWRIIKVAGQLDFSLVGIIADLSAVFKKKNISIFTVSTYDTDYILVKHKDLNAGIQALTENGHTISSETGKAP
jgi:uncharacterized protein